MNIRFYHRWIYWLYYRTWTPIYRAKPHLLTAQIDWMSRYLNTTTERK